MEGDPGDSNPGVRNGLLVAQTFKHSHQGGKPYIQFIS